MVSEICSLSLWSANALTEISLNTWISYPTPPTPQKKERKGKKLEQFCHSLQPGSVLWHPLSA